ncbi:MAG TPA: hypothetical protein VHV51_20940 [Polyangiaceae bacterium]|nr:hypothetical protein [Polyangiaceae bacterium]
MSRRILALLPSFVLACSANPANTSTARGSGGSGSTTTSSGGTSSGINTGTNNGDGGTTSLVAPCSSNCADFPTQPVFDSGAAPDSASKFGDPSAGGPNADCITEPTDGSLVPRNWWRPRIHFSPGAGETLFEIRVHADVEANDFVVYTTKNSYLMPEDVWTNVAAHAAGSALTVTVRGSGGGAISKASAKLNIAAVDAGGAMVYWATTSVEETETASKLVGFQVGEEGTVDALHITDVKESNLFNEAGAQKPTPPVSGGAPAGQVSCIGCHTSTPDGSAVAFKDGWPWAGIISSIEKDTVGQRPSYVTDVGAREIQQPFIGTFTFSPAFWSDTSHLAVSVYSAPTQSIGWTGVNRNIVTSAELTWFELSAMGTMPTTGMAVNSAVLADQNMTWGLIPRTGDTRAAVMPDWSHDGKTIVYTSTTQIAGGHVGGLSAADGVTPLTTPTESDIYTVPFNNKMGGVATAVAGAATAGVAEYYPDFSADDQLIAYTRVGNTNGYFYYRADGEIAVIPAAGGNPVRLVANDPPACSGEKSPGVLNSWPKWSPSVEVDPQGNKFYFLVFSSARHYDEQFQLTPNQYTPPGTDARASQMYLAAIMVTPSGDVTNFPAVYIWNQTPMTSNLTPAWDEFKIPQVVVK